MKDKRNRGSKSKIKTQTVSGRQPVASVPRRAVQRVSLWPRRHLHATTSQYEGISSFLQPSIVLLENLTVRSANREIPQPLRNSKIHLAQDNDRWRALVNTIMNLWVP
jgi:hypothetical protein